MFLLLSFVSSVQTCKPVGMCPIFCNLWSLYCRWSFGFRLNWEFFLRRNEKAIKHSTHFRPLGQSRCFYLITCGTHGKSLQLPQNLKAMFYLRGIDFRCGAELPGPNPFVWDAERWPSARIITSYVIQPPQPPFVFMWGVRSKPISVWQPVWKRHSAKIKSDWLIDWLIDGYMSDMGLEIWKWLWLKAFECRSC